MPLLVDKLKRSNSTWIKQT